MRRKTFFGWNLFKKTQELEDKITAFLLNIIEAGVLYERAMVLYFEEGVTDNFFKLSRQVSALETENDRYRRIVENDLYAYMILPDMRSDILKLLEGCDKVINKYESDLLLISVEKPKAYMPIQAMMTHMVHADLDCVDGLISGVKAFFAGKDVTEYTNKTYQSEHMVDQLALQLKELVFADKKLDLARQLQLKEFIYGVEKISDIAEDVADILKIMAVKHVI